MQESRVRRPLSWPLVCLLGLLLPATWSCNMPQSGPSSTQSGSSTAEAERTRKMEEKAAEIERHAEELRNMQGTEQEKIDAMNRLDQERRELNEMQEQGK
jgi:TolA-binding protein